MDRRQHQMLELFTRVHAFLLTTKPQGEVATIDHAVATLGSVLEGLRAQQQTQATLLRTNREQTVRAQRAAQRLVVGYMRPIVRMGHVLFDRLDPLRAVLVIPKTTRTEVLVEAATSLTEKLTPYLDRFVAAGLEKDGLDKLKGAAESLRASVTTRALDGARRMAATEVIRQEVIRGLAVLRLLDAMVQLPLSTDVAQQAEWRALMRRARRSGTVGGGGVVEVETAPSQVAAEAAA